MHRSDGRPVRVAWKMCSTFPCPIRSVSFTFAPDHARPVVSPSCRAQPQESRAPAREYPRFSLLWFRGSTRWRRRRLHAGGSSTARASATNSSSRCCATCSCSGSSTTAASSSTAKGKIPFALGSRRPRSRSGRRGDGVPARHRRAGPLLPRPRAGARRRDDAVRDPVLAVRARDGPLDGGRQFPNHYTNHDLGVLSISSIIAAHCTHAVGVAAAFKYRGESGRAVHLHERRGRDLARRVARVGQLRRRPRAADRVPRARTTSGRSRRRKTCR